MLHLDASAISPRVLRLLKNVTLEDISGSENHLIKVGNPITLEELNREELIRLVLCQFSRLAVKQEWDGLLG